MSKKSNSTGKRFEQFLQYVLWTFVGVSVVASALAACSTYNSIVAFFGISSDAANQYVLDSSLVALGTTLMASAVAVAGLTAYREYQSAKEASVQRTTFEHISRWVVDRDVLEMFSKFKEITSRNPDGLSAKDCESIIPADVDTIRRVLNFYEATAVGIQDGSLMEDMILQWWRTTWIKHYIYLRGFIDNHRNRILATSLFENYEYYAWTWATHREQAEIGAMPEVVRKRDNHSD